VIESYRRAARFIRETVSLRNAHPRAGFVDVLSDLPQWWRTQARGNPVADGRPWITFGAARELSKIVPQVSRAFEFGSGGSTIFLASRIAEVVSVEHDPDWLRVVSGRLVALGRTNVALGLYPPTKPQYPAGSITYESSDVRYRGLSFFNYASSIDAFGDGYFDLVLIDGRARPSCFLHAHRKIRVGGWLLLDNSERAGYKSILDAAAAWQALHYHGPGPYVPQFWRTTILKKTQELVGQDLASFDHVMDRAP
jgi:hypothetical protein